MFVALTIGHAVSMVTMFSRTLSMPPVACANAGSIAPIDKTQAIRRARQRGGLRPCISFRLLRLFVLEDEDGRSPSRFEDIPGWDACQNEQPHAKVHHRPRGAEATCPIVSAARR